LARARNNLGSNLRDNRSTAATSRLWQPALSLRAWCDHALSWASN